MSNLKRAHAARDPDLPREAAPSSAAVPRVVGKLYGDGRSFVRADVRAPSPSAGGLSSGLCPGWSRRGRLQLRSGRRGRGRMTPDPAQSPHRTGVFRGEMDTPILEVTPGSIVPRPGEVAGLPKQRPPDHPTSRSLLQAAPAIRV